MAALGSRRPSKPVVKQVMALSRSRYVAASFGLLLCALLSSCTSDGGARAATVAPAPAAPGSVIALDARGYLDPAALPDSLALVPLPPAEGSPAMALDSAVASQMLALRDSPRWQQARSDAALAFPAAANQFSCALGIEVSQQRTPHLMRLLGRTLLDASSATSAAKTRYQRPRPFVSNHAPVCTPEDEASLRGNGAYPSGHTAIGWAWGLVLAEAAPERSAALLLRGRQFGDSRLVCNVHWQSDVVQGRVMGAAAVAALHGNPEFRADLQAARKEIEDARRAGAVPARDCTAEASALAAPLPTAL